MKKLIDTVLVIGEDGRLANVYIYKKMIRVAALLSGRQPGGHLPGTKEVRDEFGRNVNLIDDDTFQVVITGEILTRA